jgi:hypothetical protein
MSPAVTKMPVSLMLPIPVLTLTLSMNIPVVAAHLQFSYFGGRIMAGQFNGAVKESDVKNIILPSLAQFYASKITADKAGGGLTSTDMSILSEYDNGGTPGPMQAGCTKACATTCQNPGSGPNACGCAMAGDTNIDECEVATNPTIKATYAPDVQLFDANGNYAPNPNATHKDSMSIGFGFTAIPANF